MPRTTLQRYVDEAPDNAARLSYIAQAIRKPCGCKSMRETYNATTKSYAGGEVITLCDDHLHNARMETVFDIASRRGQFAKCADDIASRLQQRRTDAWHDVAPRPDVDALRVHIARRRKDDDVTPYDVFMSSSRRPVSEGLSERETDKSHTPTPPPDVVRLSSCAGTWDSVSEVARRRMTFAPYRPTYGPSKFEATCAALQAFGTMLVGMCGTDVTLTHTTPLRTWVIHNLDDGTTREEARR